MHAGSAEHREELVILFLDRVHDEDYVSLLHYLLDSVYRVGAFEIVALAAGDFIGLEGEFFRHAVIEAAEVNGVCSLHPLDDLRANGHGERLPYLLRQTCKGCTEVLPGKVPDDGIAVESLLDYALGGSHSFLPATLEHASAHAFLLYRSIRIGAEREKLLVSIRLELLCESEGFLGPSGVGVHEDGICTEVIAKSLAGSVALHIEREAPVHRPSAGVLCRHDAGGAFSREEHPSCPPE